MLVVNDARQKMALLNDHNTQIEHIYHKMQEKVSLDQFELLHDKLINEYSTVLQLQTLNDKVDEKAQLSELNQTKQ